MTAAVTPAAGDLREALTRALWNHDHPDRGHSWSVIVAAVEELPILAEIIAPYRRRADAILAGPLATLTAGLAAAQARADRLEAENEGLRDRVDDLRDALSRIVQWADAYPTDIFTPPDYPAIRRTLHADGLVPGHTLDGIAADCMRRATEGVGKIARAALAHTESTGGQDA